MVNLFDIETGAHVGSLTDTQFQFIVDRLEEESSTDKDYYLNRETLAMFEQQGADPGLVQVLAGALGEREEMDVRWEKVEGA